MRNKFNHLLVICGLCASFLLIPTIVSAQQSYKYHISGDKTDSRAQLPGFLRKSYFDITVGSINYPFSADQLKPGYQLNSVEIKHTAVRLVLFGYNLNDYLAAQVTYMRPVLWVNYRYTNNTDISNTTQSRTVWMNVGGLTIKPKIPISENLTISGEAGLGIITRNGFEDNQGNTVVTDANYATILLGGGLVYNVNKKFGIAVAANYSPASKKHNQPYTSYIGTGIHYRFCPIKKEDLHRVALNGRIYPRQWLQLGYITNFAGYGVNNFTAGLNLFWGGNSEIHRGIVLSYLRNLFHSPKIFALDWGTNASFLQTNRSKDNFLAISLFPVFRLNILYTKPLDAYFSYIVAGPTYISKTILDGEDTGKNFTFYDAMALGGVFGKDRRYNAELRIAHYSNGNIFPANGGVKIPLTFNIGYTFNYSMKKR